MGGGTAATGAEGAGAGVGAGVQHVVAGAEDAVTGAESAGAGAVAGAGAGAGDPDGWLLSTIQFRPIGVIRTPYTDAAGMPIQAGGGAGAAGHIELAPCLAEGLRDIEGFSHLTLIWYLHRACEDRLMVTPFLDDRPHGIFATRAPARPNPIGMSVVRLLRVEGTRLHIEDVDMLDGSPLLDIKPYVPAFDDRSPARTGWYDERLDQRERPVSDRRFLSA
jgi:tRNA-Thr(GGU) m(6)t(6)A37 methyltransferase TsaA